VLNLELKARLKEGKKREKNREEFLIRKGACRKETN
jgi:hypothetical protein